MKEIYDVVVIGSGFGGAITAARLSQAGRSVCVLERGKRWQRSDFPRTTPELGRSFWNPRDLGLLDVRAFRRVDVIQASGVGGGSLVYLNVNWRPRKEVFEDPRWPKGITRETLEPYYDLSREVLEAKPLEPTAGFPRPPRTEAFFDAVQQTGREPTLVNLAVYTGPPRQNPYGGAEQEGCIYCGNCMLGCRVHAKNTLDLNYLAVAERNGAEVFPLHQVERIEPVDDGAGGYRVHFRRLSPEASEPGSVVGRRLVVAAGTMGTNELLLNARDVHRTLPKLSAALGKGFSINGDFLFNGTTHADREINPAFGPAITAGVEVGTGGDGVFVSDITYPDPYLWFVQGSLFPLARLRNSLAAAAAYLGRTFGLTKPWTYTKELDRFFDGNFSPRWLGYLGMGTDASNGTLRIRRGGLEVEWSFRQSMRMYRKMWKVLREFSRALNGRYRTSLTWYWPLRKLLTAHPLGGCALSDSPEQGVANEWGEVWNYPNLYVACGSVVPTALGVAPSGTIAALAERIAERM
ncbi:MAG TPA: GMC family oxidoreductase, partial [Longimicrobiaceae bacterium]|nr:GMC family oxidoreductase [Longimicrobiaceae bacterium]